MQDNPEGNTDSSFLEKFQFPREMSDAAACGVSVIQI